MGSITSGESTSRPVTEARSAFMLPFSLPGRIAAPSTNSASGEATTASLSIVELTNEGSVSPLFMSA